MKATLDCLECAMKQALRAARIASSDPAVHRRVMDDVARALPHADLNLSPAEVSLVAYESTSRHSGNPDPYYALKRQQNALAMAMEPEMRELLRCSEDPLMTALHVAAAGNIIDLGIMHADQIDVHGAIEQALREQFSIDHSALLHESLSRCEDLLYLLDNAGEIVFDKLLIEELQKHTRVTAVVKGGPILNDVVMEDAEEVGLTKVCDIIDNGGAFIGCPLDLVSASFMERMRSADVILGKGQGNYETVDDFDGDVFLLLKAKCEIIARHMGVTLGQVALISTRHRAAGVTPLQSALPELSQ
jgi:uncharacterized protein with ATP-grasp and redox domains